MCTTPHERLHKDAVSITVLVMFLALAKLIDFIKQENPENKSLAWIVSATAAALGSRWIYSLITNSLISWAQSQTWIKRRYLGRAFTHGTWYGILRTKGNYLRVYVEQYDQNFEELTIRGASFRLPTLRDHLKNPEHFPLDATWITRATRINESTGELYCFYENNVLRKHYPVLAVGHFNLEYDRWNFPIELRGYAIDVDAGIERGRDAILKAHGPNKEDPEIIQNMESLFANLDLASRVRLNYERAVKARRAGIFANFFLRCFADEILTTEEAKAKAIQEFTVQIEEEDHNSSDLRSGDRVGIEAPAR